MYERKIKLPSTVLLSSVPVLVDSGTLCALCDDSLVIKLYFHRRAGQHPEEADRQAVPCTCGGQAAQYGFGV